MALKDCILKEIGWRMLRRLRVNTIKRFFEERYNEVEGPTMLLEGINFKKVDQADDS